MLRQTKTENGGVRGLPAADPRITVYKGIPFAAPPVGELRWRAPQPAQDWEGVKECAEFAPISMQGAPGTDPKDFYAKEWHVDPDLPMSEDCLYLNVWTPAKVPEEKLPVMVWIFGGGMTCGYTVEMEMDGERMARRGVVLVSVNYRVNAFGFLTHPEITAQAQARGELSANFGQLDQKAGIEWVKRNIGNFGGDPENITVFGQSAGGRSTWIQVCSPLNAGLFQRAIIQSGGLVSPVGRYPMLAKSYETGKAFLAHLGVASIAQARGMDARELYAKTESFAGPRWTPVIDGALLSADPYDMVRENNFNHVDILTGNTVDEGFGTRIGDTVAEFEENVRKIYGGQADAYLKIANIGTKGELERLYRSPGYNIFEIGGYLLAQVCEDYGRKPVYLYRFHPEIPGDDTGSFHSSDLWFVFETLAKCWRPFTGKHYDLARIMCNYWTNFAKTGNPNGNDADSLPMPLWRPAAGTDKNSMFFGDTAEMLREGMDENLSFILRNIEKLVN